MYVIESNVAGTLIGCLDSKSVQGLRRESALGDGNACVDTAPEPPASGDVGRESRDLVPFGVPLTSDLVGRTNTYSEALW